MQLVRIAVAGGGALGTAELLPAWLGDEAFHRGDRSALVRKDAEHCALLFGDVPDALP